MDPNNPYMMQGGQPMQQNPYAIPTGQPVDPNNPYLA
eukprot:CAMPEP_0185609314 /NCGR_PEP_ID=MMETSP0436-20130131/9674_1 /TAXON_ID=626734 ORGANISM="Favella taraikaensis, Strain Fe Narragansett Bay" /NCGR_SAMPLE_ID=MMETSP0436 /ASSEMBLY_ACC=CAM_ASM_000390 /LENGTH=36 /DNA_ID= /DNA_START= /DNA_END= /DNA_ORIENTATION=